MCAHLPPPDSLPQVNAHRECAVELPYDCRTYTDLYAAPSMAQSLVSMTSSNARPMDTGDGELLTLDSPTDLIPVYRLPGQAMPTWCGVRVPLYTHLAVTVRGRHRC